MLNDERPRRLRASAFLRNLIAEHEIRASQLIQPYFLTEGKNTQEPIQGFTGIYRWGVDSVSKQIEADLERGVKSFLLFGKTSEKSDTGAAGYSEKGVVPSAVRELKKRFGHQILLFTDVCLCPYTTHGHCGLVTGRGAYGPLEGSTVDNDSSLEPLARQAVCHAEAGVDFVAPSDMMDGRVGAIRSALDLAGLSHVGILAYTAKYASSYYGPFREALDSSPKTEGNAPSDRSTYQMDFRNSREALRELKLDLAEGADMVMVKPALAYLDIIAKFREHANVPVVAYSVSGEYEMVKQMAAKGMADEKAMAIENLTAIRRAGADAIITYFASEGARKEWFR